MELFNVVVHISYHNFMKMRKIYFLFFISVISCNPKVNNSLKIDTNERIQRSLSNMRTHFLNKDFEEYLNYIYPELIKEAGGMEQMAQLISSSMSQFENEGFIVKDLQFDEPTHPIRENDELQCTVTQSLDMATPKGNFRRKTTLIGISRDSGNSWTFITTQGKNLEEMKNRFPNLSSRLVIPQESPLEKIK